MNSKLIILFLFLLSINTASAYIEPRTPYVVESTVEGITEDENGYIIITDHGCLFEVNTTFHYRYGFENIDTILAVVRDHKGNSLDFDYMELNQTSTKEGYAKVWLEIPGENRTAGKYTIRYTLEGSFDKMFLSSSANFVIEPIEEEEEEEPEIVEVITPMQEEPELNLVAPSQDDTEIQTNEKTTPIQEENYTISPVYFAIAVVIIVAIFLRKDD